MRKSKEEKLADRIINEMIKEGIDPENMLKIIQLTKKKFLKNRTVKLERLILNISLWETNARKRK